MNEAENISDSLREFVTSFYESYYKKTLFVKMVGSTDVENDLGITGDDADDFLAALVKKFNLNYNEFDGRKYFGYEHESFDFFLPLLRFFFGQKKWLPLPKRKRDKLTLNMLDEAIRTGKLR